MHEIQQSLLGLIEKTNIARLTLREIAKLIDPAIYPQQIKHHLEQLNKRGLIRIDNIKKVVEPVRRGKIENTNLISIPILGSANCGPALAFATQAVEGYLQLSESFLPKKKDNIFALNAIGSSMNKANIRGKNIEEGDYIIIDGDYVSPQNNDYVLSVIDGKANIKKFMKDEQNNTVVLFSESTKDFPPIYIHANDEYDYMINGKVIDVIKRPKTTV